MLEKTNVLQYLTSTKACLIDAYNDDDCINASLISLKILFLF